MTFIATKLFHKAGEGSGGGGGGDQHNLGWYATESALTTAHPTASDGDYAIVGDTDTVWVWDSDTTAWKDTGQAGIELPSQTGNSGKFLTTNGTAASWSDKPLVNTTQQSSDGLTILGTPATVGTGGINIGVGSSTANAGVTIGTSASTNGGVAIGYNASGKIAIGNSATCGTYSYLAIGTKANAGNLYGTAIGEKSKATGNTALAIGYMTEATANTTLAIGGVAQATAAYAIQIGGVNMTNNEANTIKIGLGNSPAQNYKLLDSDGTIPSDRLVHAINKYSTMPTASADNLGWIVQFTGTTDSTYTHGHLYECVSDGQTPATYSWTEVSMGGGGGLPDQTGQSGKFLTTDGTDASWSDKPLINQLAGGTGSVGIKTYVYNNDCVAINSDTVLGSNGVTLIGKNAFANDSNHYAVGIGYGARINAPNAILINASGTNQYNGTANTFKIGNTNGVFEMMDANGNLPADRLASTTGLTDGNYRLRLTMTDGVPSLSWVAE